jgi:hypothetical protein
VVVGDDGALARIAEMIPDVLRLPRNGINQMLEISKQLRHPGDLIRRQANNPAKALECLPRP